MDFRPGPHPGRRRDDPNRGHRRHHGVHVAGTGSWPKDLDQRSDLFALGLILYEMLTGKQPFFRRQRSGQPHQATQERAIPVSDIDNQIPGVERIVSKCLERDLDERYQSASAILADLNTWKDKRAAGTIRLDAAVKRWGGLFPGRSLQEL